MSLWEINAAIVGWNRVHGGKPVMEPPSDAEFDEAVARWG